MDLPVHLIVNCLAFLDPFRVTTLEELNQLCLKLPVLHVVELDTKHHTSPELDLSFCHWDKSVKAHISEREVCAPSR